MIAPSQSTPVHGVGIDIVSVREVRDALQIFGGAYAVSVCHPQELPHAPSGPLARARWVARLFAAKEAAWKAAGVTGDPPLRWSWLQVREDNGRTTVHLPDHLTAQPGTRVAVTTSIAGEHALALAVGVLPATSHSARPSSRQKYTLTEGKS